MSCKTENLFFLLGEAQNRNSDAMLRFIQTFKPKLQTSLYQTSISEREDLAQELNMKIIEAIYNYDLDTIPGFFDFLDQIENKQRS
ncbi:hypothetical protein C2W64_01972 [Brevibacillus laterosporus]|nr:helix-turn-helix domain-containing protein [Brevibacillus laterosporus]RAP26428.1 hypothetical protein C2W64_01972 [Brevibacillus laterosporus]